MPGPPVIVCRGDTVDVTVHNHLMTETFTLHWHGKSSQETTVAFANVKAKLS